MEHDRASMSHWIGIHGLTVWEEMSKGGETNESESKEDIQSSDITNKHGSDTKS